MPDLSNLSKPSIDTNAGIAGVAGSVATLLVYFFKLPLEVAIAATGVFIFIVCYFVPRLNPPVDKLHTSDLDGE